MLGFSSKINHFFIDCLSDFTSLKLTIFKSVWLYYPILESKKIQRAKLSNIVVKSNNIKYFLFDIKIWFKYIDFLGVLTKAVPFSPYQTCEIPIELMTFYVTNMTWKEKFVYLELLRIVFVQSLYNHFMWEEQLTF